MAAAALDATFAFQAEGRRRQKGFYSRKVTVFQEISRQTSTHIPLPPTPQRCTVCHLEMGTQEHRKAQTRQAQLLKCGPQGSVVKGCGNLPLE